MRIIAGSKRGMKLLSPAKRPGRQRTRPITDRVKESLFNVLYNKYHLPEGKFVADLFCGTGSLGLEALSRVADGVIFVETDKKAIAILRRNIDRAGFADKSKVISADAFKVGAPGGFEGRKPDLVFVDPPYVDSRDAKAGSALGELLILVSQQITQDGIVVVRTHRKTSLIDEYDRLQTIERRQWGTMAVTILGLKAD